MQETHDMCGCVSEAFEIEQRIDFKSKSKFESSYKIVPQSDVRYAIKSSPQDILILKIVQPKKSIVVHFSASFTSAFQLLPLKCSFSCLFCCFFFVINFVYCPKFFVGHFAIISQCAFQELGGERYCPDWF